MSLALLLVGACSGEAAPPDTTYPADLEPAAVVDELLAAVSEGRFEDAASLTDVRQAGLLALAEGAEVGEVVDSLDEDATGVAANFWSGFAQSLMPSYDPAAFTVEAGEVQEQDGERYVPVVVTDPDGEERTFYLREEEGGWKIDLIATFAPLVAERLTPRVESLLTSANPEAAEVVSRLNRAIPSLEVAARSTLDVATYQSVLALIERITRAG